MSWSCRRHRDQGIEHVPVWDLPLTRGVFWERVGAARPGELQQPAAALAADVVDALERLRDRFGFDLAWLGGGVLERPGLRERIARDAPCPLLFDDAGRFVGERGGRELLARHRQPNGAVVDVGQTAIKASRGSHRVVHERDLDALPLRLIGSAGGCDGAPPAAAAGFIAAAIAAIAPTDPCVVLALPGPLGDALAPGPCSYGWQGDTALVPELLRRLDAAQPAPAGLLLLLNDAELAGLSARADPRCAARTRVLALTLGFGPGAALVDAADQSA